MSSMIKSLFKKPEKVPESVEGLKIKLSPAVRQLVQRNKA